MQRSRPEDIERVDLAFAMQGFFRCAIWWADIMSNQIVK
jgi:hypothetical protein